MTNEAEHGQWEVKRVKPIEFTRGNRTTHGFVTEPGWIPFGADGGYILMMRAYTPKKENGQQPA